MIRQSFASLWASGAAVAAALVIAGCSQGSSTQAQASDTYAAVAERGTLECGYIPYPPAMMKDPNTGELSGIFHDAIETAAGNLGWKVEWKEEVQWGTMIEGLRTKRYDAMCSSVWSNSARWAQADFTTPLYFSGVSAYVKTGDSRFDANIAVANSPEFKIATIDGDTSEAIARQLFPKAQLVSLPQLTDYSQILLAVKDGKADLTFAEPYYALQFAKANGEGIAPAGDGTPLRVFGNSMMVRKGDVALQSTLDGALMELLNDGTIDRLVEQYAGGKNAYLPVAHPYRRD